MWQTQQQQKSPPAAPFPAPSPQEENNSITTFSDAPVSLSKDGRYVGFVFHPNDKKNMCDIAFQQSAPKPWKIIKRTDGYYDIMANCDGDAKFTSRLSDNANDLIQAGRMSTDVWKVECPSATQGCSIQAKKSKKYLSANGLSDQKVYWIIKNA